jgi:hypothetical protein
MSHSDTRTVLDRVTLISRKMRDAERSMADARHELNDLVASLGFIVPVNHDERLPLDGGSFPPPSASPAARFSPRDNSGDYPVQQSNDQ